MSEKRCPRCQELGYCTFEKIAARIAQLVPVVDDEKQQLEAATRANEIITRKRAEAKARGCANADAFDPEYPGKNLL